MSDPIGPGFRPAVSHASGPPPTTGGLAASTHTAVADLATVTQQPGFTHETRDGKIYTRQTVKLAAPPEKVLAGLQGDWSKWWLTGRRHDLQHSADGTTRWNFEALHLPIRISNFNIAMGVPHAEPLPDKAAGFKLVIPIALSGGFVGPARYEISKAADGGTYLTSIWDGVTPKGMPGLIPKFAGWLHLTVERKAYEHLGAL